ncbi:MAG TPA: hypothetical protein VFL90_18020 [Methylomirabilota bacterium]|nr:hypothetical protein [Methylomirabilota bacterium]
MADDVKVAQRRALAALSAEERVRLALRLGARDLETFRLAHDPPLDPAEATRRLRLQRQRGRRPSACLRERPA